MCCQQTRDCYGNRHFIPMTKGYIEEDKVHGVIDEMFYQLLAVNDDMDSAGAGSTGTGIGIGTNTRITYRNNSTAVTVQKDFPPLSSNDMYHQHLILSASICQSNPPVAMFVASKKWISAVV